MDAMTTPENDPAAPLCATCKGTRINPRHHQEDGDWYEGVCYDCVPPSAASGVSRTPSEQLADAREAEGLARLFHETYERLAPTFGYETRKESAVAWEDVPGHNRGLMIAVAASILGNYIKPRAAEWDVERTRLVADAIAAEDALLDAHLAISQSVRALRDAIDRVRAVAGERALNECLCHYNPGTGLRLDIVCPVHDG